MLLSNFSFLEKWPQLADLGTKAEEYLYSDTKAALNKLRIFGEAFARIVIDCEGLYSENLKNASLSQLLYVLKCDGSVPKELINTLHSIRISGNPASHYNPDKKSDIKQALDLLFYAYELGIWLKQTYDDYEFDPLPFQIPDRDIELGHSDIQKQIQDVTEQLQEIKSLLGNNQPAHNLPRKPDSITKQHSLEPRNQNESLTIFTVEGLRQLGFGGFITVQQFWENGTSSIPDQPGVYAVLRNSSEIPEFLPTSVGGRFKDKDPTVTIDILHKHWVDGAEVLYLGKAGGQKSRSTLKERINTYLKFGSGRKVGHWGGRLIWQLSGYENLMIAYKVLPDDEDPEILEKKLIGEFKTAFGKKPFANLRI
jgi:hypothetical protein